MKFSTLIHDDGRRDAYCQVSDCGKFSIAKTFSRSVPHYEAWIRGTGRRMLGRWRADEDSKGAYQAAKLACAREAGE